MKDSFPPEMSRTQRRRFKTLDEAVDRVTQADRAFFSRFPHRVHRLRLMSAPEREQLAIMNQDHRPPPRGLAWAVAVKRVSGGRIRGYVTVLEGANLNLAEDVCREVFNATAGEQGRAVEAAMRQAFGPGALH